ncbi:MAG: hypothetical protein RIC55_23070 [Pirellulaceae bacterium]
MARAELESRWITRCNTDEIARFLERFCGRHRVKVVGRREGELVGKQGSQWKTRLLGGWFVNPADFPKRITIHYQPRGADCEVHVRMEETMGLGILDAHFKGRYESYFNEWMEQLQYSIPPVDDGPGVVDAIVVEP